MRIIIRTDDSPDELVIIIVVAAVVVLLRGGGARLHSVVVYIAAAGNAAPALLTCVIIARREIISGVCSSTFFAATHGPPRFFLHRRCGRRNSSLKRLGGRFSLRPLPSERSLGASHLSGGRPSALNRLPPPPDAHHRDIQPQVATGCAMGLGVRPLGKTLDDFLNRRCTERRLRSVPGGPSEGQILHAQRTQVVTARHVAQCGRAGLRTKERPRLRKGAQPPMRARSAAEEVDGTAYPSLRVFQRSRTERRQPRSDSAKRPYEQVPGQPWELVPCRREQDQTVSAMADPNMRGG